jgi:hypothetical protein
MQMNKNLHRRTDAMDDDGVRTAVIVVRDIRGGYEFHGLPSLAIV